ncbi:MAG: hypothetical protein F6K40_01770 [Okeania sp. SIO3I5]|uniref:hypothetical protein n=1 Tax=Okeania sp. SIO3I5 TaxID=2607805 RepID=UPI0013B76CC7|nr:hypothetical protein [Okeania sp. SIO3I5]NEQ35104.1 hypothetical protein [Okeania sp. SIO3I5]
MDSRGPQQKNNQTNKYSFGRNDRIHGWNKEYQYTNHNQKYQCNDQEYDSSYANQYMCFEFKQNQLEAFHNQPVLTPEKDPNNNQVPVKDSNGHTLTDHQGHIVPQSALKEVLNDIANEILNDKLKNLDYNNLNNLENYDHNKQQKVYQAFNEFKKLFKDQVPMTYNIDNYIINKLCGSRIEKLIQQKDGAKITLEDAINDYLSIIVWNPVNICRAPEDKHRNGYPGEKIDNEVRERVIQIYPKNARIRGAFEKVKSTLDKEKQEKTRQIKEFIGSCNEALGQQSHGYYKFDWQYLLTKSKELQLQPVLKIQSNAPKS